MSVMWQNERGEVVKSSVDKLPDGTYAVTYTPQEVAHYTISVKYAGQEVPNGPFHVNTVPSGNATAVKPLSQYCNAFIHSQAVGPVATCIDETSDVH